ncbi:hypothetical protein AA3990_1499 [Gluconobacter roseus NBRC 3990]|nr:hypothetical protein AA3990_1499 [Gluconobacter roseus NBRC 3990]
MSRKRTGFFHRTCQVATAKQGRKFVNEKGKSNSRFRQISGDGGRGGAIDDCGLKTLLSQMS